MTSPLLLSGAGVALLFVLFSAWVASGSTLTARRYKRWVKKNIFGMQRDTKKYEGRPGDGSNAAQARNG